VRPTLTINGPRKSYLAHPRHEGESFENYEDRLLSLTMRGVDGARDSLLRVAGTFEYRHWSQRVEQHCFPIN
jgi:hypothetical protein